MSLSALDGTGVDLLIDVIASRLALDICQVRLTVEPDAPDARERISLLYKHGRVLEHLVEDGRTVVRADVPRRLLAWFQLPPR